MVTRGDKGVLCVRQEEVEEWLEGRVCSMLTMMVGGDLGLNLGSEPSRYT